MNRRALLFGASACGALFLIGCGGNRAASETSAPSPAMSAVFTSARISVVARGAGPDIVLIPGMTSHRAVWNDTVAALEGRYRFHLVQVNGFAGFPAAGNTEGEVAAPAAEEIARYIEDAGLERSAVIGHSMGGTIAMMLAARHPDTLSRLMVVDMLPFMGAMFGPPGTTPDSIRPTADRIRAATQNVPPGQLSPTIEQMISSMTRSDAARPLLLTHARESDPRVVGNAFHELIVTDLRPDLAHIDVPATVLYVYPPNMPISAEQLDAFYVASFANLPHGQLKKISDSNHFIMIDQPQRFRAEIEIFMAR